MTFLILPFLASVILVLIHVYFGAYVLRRGILFIDIALAQWAALGYLFSHLWHLESAAAQYGLAFGFTAIAAVLLSLFKRVFTAVKFQEAIIGVMYIFASALSAVLLSTTGLEGHHLQDMLVGHLLFVSWQELASAFSLYSSIALVYFWMKKRWSLGGDIGEFLFYLAFGLVVTSSVKIAGVLVVFAFLVLPILAIVLWSSELTIQIRRGWAVGILSTVLGLTIALTCDIPPGFAIILSLCGLWIASIGLWLLTGKKLQS